MTENERKREREKEGERERKREKERKRAQERHTCLIKHDIGRDTECKKICEEKINDI